MAGYIGSKSSVTQVDGYTEAEADAEFVTKTGDTMTGDLNLGANTLSLGANNANSPQILFENSDGVTGDAALSTYDDASGTMLVMGSNFYINSSGSESRFNTSEESSAVMLNRNGDLNLLTGGTGATATTRLKIDSSGNVGIGTSSPSYPLTTLAGTENTQVAQFTGADVGRGLRIETSSTTRSDDTAILNASDAFGELAFETDSTERMRIDSSGRLFVGKTVNSIGTAGTVISTVDGVRAAVANDPALLLGRTGSDGTIANFYKDGSSVGSIGSRSGGSNIYVESAGGSGRLRANGTDVVGWNNTNLALFSATDGGSDLGTSGNRFDDIYATNGTIQTSDRNEKQDIAALTSTEMLVGKRISALFKTFRWKDKVVEKGDNARTHTGVIAQDVQAAFTAEGLDAGDYALFISTTWWETQTEVPAVEAVTEVTDEDGNVTTEAVEAKDAYTRTDTYDTEDEAPEGATSKTRMGIRYPELLSFVAAYNEQRFASIEARLTALEA